MLKLTLQAKGLPEKKVFFALTIKTSLETFTEKNDFVFFTASITSMFPRPLNTWLGKTGIGKFYYYCPAYNYALLLEI